MFIAIAVIAILAISGIAVHYAFQSQSKSGVSVCAPLGDGKSFQALS